MYVLFQSPADSLCHSESLAWETTAIVGRAEVCSGEIVFGDIDGVTVVPEEIAKKVLLEAEKCPPTKIQFERRSRIVSYQKLPTGDTPRSEWTE